MTRHFLCSRDGKTSLRIVVAIVAAILIVTVGTVYTYRTPSDTVEIGYSALRISLPVFVAQEKGYFESEGLDVKLTRFDTAQPLMSSLVAGNVQIAGYTALPITYNAMVRSQTELYHITAMLEDQKHRISYLLIPKDAPDSYTIAQLKGKKIGILPTLAYRVWLQEILKHNGINPSEVEIVQISPALSPSALESGQVDALFTNDPAATTVLQKGIGRLLSDKVEVPEIFGEGFVFGSFNIRKDYADSHPEITLKVTRALDRAVQFVDNNPAKAKEIMKKYLHSSQKPYVDYYPDAFYQTTSNVEPAKFQEIADRYFKIGIIPEKLWVEDEVITARNFSK